jgi:RNA polymerase sigma-70 factor (ECF subfamily)
MKPRASLEAKDNKTALDAEYWVEKYGDVLFGFAAARVRDRSVAEDLVQETFLGALKSKAAFAGRSNERAWLFGILRNKLVDHYRLQKREVLFGEDERFLTDESSFIKDGVRRGSWDPRLAPKAWETPDESLSKKEFQAVLQKCMSRLPERLGDLFRMREIDAASFEQICEELEISANHASVLLHRARMSLRRCLEVHWFSPGIRNKQSPRTAPGEEDMPS